MNNPKAFGLCRSLHRQCMRYPAWIRTMNNASKGRCVTVTPRGIDLEPVIHRAQSEPAPRDQSLER